MVKDSGVLRKFAHIPTKVMWQPFLPTSFYIPAMFSDIQVQSHVSPPILLLISPVVVYASYICHPSSTPTAEIFIILSTPSLPSLVLLLLVILNSNDRDVPKAQLITMTSKCRNLCWLSIPISMSTRIVCHFPTPYNHSLNIPLSCPPASSAPSAFLFLRSIFQPTLHTRWLKALKMEQP